MSSEHTKGMAQEYKAERDEFESEVIALRAQNAELVEALRGIANAKRFDRTIFADDDSFVGWAQSCARHALAKMKP